MYTHYLVRVYYILIHIIPLHPPVSLNSHITKLALAQTIHIISTHTHTLLTHTHAHARKRVHTVHSWELITHFFNINNWSTCFASMQDKAVEVKTVLVSLAKLKVSNCRPQKSCDEGHLQNVCILHCSRPSSHVRTLDNTGEFISQWKWFVQCNGRLKAIVKRKGSYKLYIYY